MQNHLYNPLRLLFHLGEIKAVGDCINDFASPEAIIVTGTVLDESASSDLTVTVIATGLNSSLQTASNKPQNVRVVTAVTTLTF